MAKDPVSLKNAKVLIVDDSPTNLDLLRRVLEPLGYRVFFATTGQKALDIIPDDPPDVILLDVMMPGMDGFETCERIKRLPGAQHIPVIFVTARTQVEDLARAFAIGAADYITKPVKQAEVEARVRTQLTVHLLLRERKRREVFYRRLSAENRLVLDSVGEGILRIDARGRVSYANLAAAKLLGHTREELVGQPEKSLLGAAVLPVREPGGKPLAQRPGALGRTRQDAMRRKDGSTFPVEYTRTPLRGKAGASPGTVLVFQDVTARRLAEEQLAYMAHYDYLTDLPNRALFQVTLEKAVSRARRHQRPVALLFLDLDHFKNINDSLGHDIGDLLLKEVAHALSASVRESDTVARLGGDEFMVVVEDIATRRDAMVVARNILDGLSIPFFLNEHKIAITTSIGIATYPDCAEDAATLIKQADTAMYQAKKRGRNNYHCFTPEIATDDLRRLGKAG